MDREKLNTKISELVDVLRTEEDRRISMSDIASITEVLITTMSRYFASIDTTIYREFQDLSDHITTMRTEIARAQPKEIKAKKIPRAGRELDAVVQATEDATNTIMEAVETIMAADTTDVEAYALAVNDQCMRIFEACSFQDITGQRVTKVIKTLTFIEERIGSILTAWPEGEDMVDEASAEAAPGDKELLNGPALEGEGISQNDVDSLFDEEAAPAAEEAAIDATDTKTPQMVPFCGFQTPLCVVYRCGIGPFSGSLRHAFLPSEAPPSLVRSSRNPENPSPPLRQGPVHTVSGDRAPHRGRAQGATSRRQLEA